MIVRRGEHGVHHADFTDAEQGFTVVAVEGG